MFASQKMWVCSEDKDLEVADSWWMFPCHPDERAISPNGSEFLKIKMRSIIF